MRIAVFGGSFDPVHIEHIRLAKAAIRELSLDKLLVMPAHKPPHKRGKILSSNEDRLACCRLAFAGVEGVEVSSYEMDKGGTSYTYLTCRALKEEYQNAELFLLVGTDMLRDFPTWKRPEDVLENATLAVCGRDEKGAWIEAEQEKFFARFHKKFVYLRHEGRAVSSTEIRVRAGAGLPQTELSPAVAAYIEEKGLYAIGGAREALALEKPDRQAHSVRVALLACARANSLHIPEKQAIAAALFHDCAKNLEENSPYLAGFTPPTEWGEVPRAVVHQFAGAYLAERTFAVQDGEVLDAIRYHMSGRPKMGELEKLIFLADMLEEERVYEGVEELRALFWQGDSLDGCLKKALEESLKFIEKKGGEAYALTRLAYEYYAEK